MLPDAFLTFLSELIKIRPPGAERGLILDILTYIECGPFESLYPTVLQPLERALLDNSPDSQLDLLRFYTRLIENWTVSLSASDNPPPSGR